MFDDLLCMLRYQDVTLCCHRGGAPTQMMYYIFKEYTFLGTEVHERTSNASELEVVRCLLSFENQHTLYGGQSRAAHPDCFKYGHTDSKKQQGLCCLFKKHFYGSLRS